MMNNGRPLTKRQTVRLLIVMTILAWATQTLMQQWGYGAELPATAPAEKFVPSNSPGMASRGATLEIRSEATVIGAEVKLRQICRWSDRDKPMLEPIGDLVLVRLGQGAPFKAISAEQIRETLSGAGVNIAAIRFAGATTCTVSRSDVEYNEQDALQKWIETREAATPQPQTAVVAVEPLDTPATQPQSPLKTLRDTLVEDLATRLNLPAESLQVDFKAQDQKLLNIATPLFQFEVQPVRAKSLGQVMWDVVVRGGEAEKRKATISADARAWQEQVVVSKPLAFRQIIRADDLIQRRTLVSQLTDDPLLQMHQIVDQQASRELRPGMIMTSKMVDAVQLVRTGQFVTVTLEQGTVKIKMVTRALESGVYGQTIKVKNEATKDILQVMLIGPQTATLNLGTPVASTGQN
jgi:flagella basal body P-ring formation protein FlgA